jgi:hypothetical protein
MGRTPRYQDYFIVVTRDPRSPGYGWQIKRRAKPMGVKLEDHNLASHHLAKAAGKRALEQLLDGISTEKLLAAIRIPIK